ncbi:MAG: phosphotransferase [Pseudomonadota bacterium]|nr:phosphotransferase [Pseudomonadota bacterium]
MNESAVPDGALQRFVHDQGWAPEGEALRWTPLAGGVSSDIWRVDLDTRTICVKRALPRLKVASDWQAPIARNAHEWEWLRFAASLRPGLVPEPLAHDPVLGAFAMSFLDPASHPVWKQQLLDGFADPLFAQAVGTELVLLHGASAGDAALAQTFATDAVFRAIRLEPYLLATAQRHRDLAACLNGLAERTASCKLALVHGDVSPKNLLAGPDGPVFLDAECAWYGDPAFDLAFCLTHLLLKCVARRQSVADYLRCFDALTRAYVERVDWEPAQATEERAATLLPALLLARIDGKSPVEYLDQGAQALVRQTARAMLVGPVQSLAGVAASWHQALAT